MVYKYFIGCNNSNEIKLKYKELVKIHHPDKGGKKENFTDMMNEYEDLNNRVNTYPIANQRVSAYEEALHNMNKAREYAKRANDVVEDIVMDADSIWDQFFGKEKQPQNKKGA